MYKQFLHDCHKCEFYGNDVYDNMDVDIYLCQSFLPVRSIILRYGNAEYEYISQPLFCSDELTSLDAFAIQKQIKFNEVEQDRYDKIVNKGNKG
jgi:hypothetical protein